MSDLLTFRFSGMSGTVSVEAPSDSSVADVRAAGNISDNLGIAVEGQRVAAADEANTPAQPLMTTLPPEVKAGA